MSSALLQSKSQSTGFFEKTELAFIALILAVVAANIVVDIQGPQRVAWGSFSLGMTAAVGFVLLSGYYRIAYKHVAWLGKGMMTVVLGAMCGLLTGILIHQHMPRPEPVLTEALLKMDLWFGYDWPKAVDWVASVPFLGTFLRWVYFSSFFQIALLMIVLAYARRNRDLDAMMFTNALALIFVFIIWQGFPNLSQSTYFPIPVETAAAASLVTHSAYGAAILELAQNGLPIVSMDRILGAVAFPSYHMVMCALVVVFARGTTLFWPYLIINIIMIPAILIHGAHHIADIFGGIVVMGLAMVPAYMISNYCHRSNGTANADQP